MKLNVIVLLIVTMLICGCTSAPKINMTKLPDETRAEQIKDMKFGMFICWSFSTFYGQEWTPTLDKDASYFKATGCDTDQWCETAKAAGMNYILFLSKHHDGFCLWDTATTEKKVTNSPLGIDVLAKLRKSCDKYGIKLALYFSEGDWNWPGAVDGKGKKPGGVDPEMKKAQLKELLTNYGPIEFWWMDHAVGTGGLSHKETVEWVHKFQPNTFVGFNHGQPAGRLCLRELGRPGKLGDASATKYNKKAEGSYKGYLAAEFTYPILPPHKGGAMWFYSLPKHDGLCKPAESLYKDYVGAKKYGNIFSIDVGPNYEGRLRDIDVKTLKRVGEMIRSQNSTQPKKPMAGCSAQTVRKNGPKKPDVSVTDLRCEYLTDPLGVDVNPRFSWKIADSNKTRGQKQTAYQIVVWANTPDNVKRESVQLWDSGKVNSSTSVNNEYAGAPLKSNQNCYWKVRIWDKDGNVSDWCRKARFSMGLLKPSDWQGDWIRKKEADNIKHIWYRKKFSLKDVPTTAFVHLASIGYHELYVNGQRIGTRILSPGVSNLEKRILYVTYDIAGKLKKGDNVIAVWAGPGWARADGSYGKGVWKQDSVFKCQADMSNGTSFHSDASWKCKISSSENLGLWKGGGRGEYGGEIVDARKYIPDWNKASYDDSGWANASAYEKSIKMTAELMEPDRKVETLWPVKMTAGDGFYTFDMGRNFTGWLEMKLKNGKAGETIKFFTANDPGIKVQFKQESHYIHDESGEGIFSHRFNYMAGRWVSVEGLSYKPELEDLKCYIVTNDRKRTGSFECSKKLFNDIYETDLKTYIANTVNGVVMDCPHRERYGYGEIALACTWGCGIPNYESAPFYSKNTRDWYDVQLEDGFVNTIAPQIYKGAGGTLWSSAPITLTWEYYKAYGDKRKLAEGYQSMKKWLDYLNKYVSEDGVLTAYAKASRFLGDWATPHGSEYGDIPAAKLFNNCVYAYNLSVFVQAAEILGKGEVAAVYSKRLAELRKNAHKHFFNKDTKTYIDGRQLSMAFPLYTGITPPHEREAVFANFVKEITVNKPYLDTGSPGLPILLKYIIEDVERVDLLYHCLDRTEHPGYGYFLADGQTTWPEYWKIKGIKSKIHTCYTSIAGYFTKGIGGILPDPENYGMKNFIIKPNIVGDLTYANTTSGSYYGSMVSNWSRAGNTGKFHIEIPANTTAKVYIPANNVKDILESGRPAAKANGVKLLRMEKNKAVFRVESGNYEFVTQNYKGN